MENNQKAFILFKTEDEKISVDVRFEEDTVWLTQEQMAVLFGKAKSTINEHIQNVFNEGELSENLSVKKFGISEFQQKASNCSGYGIFGLLKKYFIVRYSIFIPAALIMIQKRKFQLSFSKKCKTKFTMQCMDRQPLKLFTIELMQRKSLWG